MTFSVHAESNKANYDTRFSEFGKNLNELESKLQNDFIKILWRF